MAIASELTLVASGIFFLIASLKNLIGWIGYLFRRIYSIFSCGSRSSVKSVAFWFYLWVF